MRSAVATWHLACWTRKTPGRGGLWVIAAMPLALALPFEVLADDGGQEAAVGISCAWAVLLSAIVGRTTGVPGGWLLWPYQKGASVSDHMVARWVMDLALVAAAILAWCGVWALLIASGARPGSLPIVAATAAAMLLTALWATALLFLVGASGTERTTDVLAALSVVSIAQLVFIRRLPAPWDQLVHAVLPPLLEATGVVAQVASGDVHGMAANAGQVFAWSLACMVGAVVQLRRWRPDE